MLLQNRRALVHLPISCRRLKWIAIILYFECLMLATN